jgi:hypothetical protein
MYNSMPFRPAIFPMSSHPFVATSSGHCRTP